MWSSETIKINVSTLKMSLIGTKPKVKDYRITEELSKYYFYLVIQSTIRGMMSNVATYS